MQEDNKACFFGFSFRHHGKHTAFHGLADALRDQIVVDASPPWPAWIPRRIEWRMNWRWLYLAEYRLKKYYAGKERRVFHYFFPENTMFRAHEWKRHHALIATCHQPVERISRPREGDDRFNRFLSGVRASDRLVVQCESLVAGYTDLFPENRIEYVPLGVDTDFFGPAPCDAGSGSGRPRILSVGNWLRDYRTWAAAVRRLRERGCDAEFVVIANPDTQNAARRELGGADTGVTFLCGLTDEELRDEYARASVFFLSLDDAMANDALLEGLASGCAIVVTDLPATRDYAGSGARYVERGNREQAADAILALLEDRDTADALRRSARERAVREFSWTAVAARYRALYEDVRNR